MNHGYPFVAWLRRSVPLVCGPVLMLALMEAVAFGSCGDYLLPASGEHASVATRQNRNENASLAASIIDFERDGMPIKGPSRCSSGRCEGIPPLPIPTPVTRTEAHEPIHFLIDLAGGEGDSPLSYRWSLPADDRFPQSHKGSVDPPPPKG